MEESSTTTSAPATTSSTASRAVSSSGNSSPPSITCIRYYSITHAALHIKHLKPLARGASKKRTSLAPTKPTGPKVLGQRNTTSTESQDSIVRLYDTFIMFSAAGGHIALRQHIALLLVRHQSADCPRGTHAVWPGRRARSPDPHHRCTAWAS